jgi:AAA family ATP:ADP antiporter
MEKTQKSGFVAELRRIFWPIEWHENKKFLPMAAMMFCILFNYSALRSIKDGFVVTSIGPEALGFLKTYLVLPLAVVMMVVYAKLCNVMSQQKVFYTITSFFTLFLSFFAFVLYPYPDLVHPASEAVESLALAYPNFKWFIRIWGQWSFAIFYAMAELYGSMMLSLLFWQFANQITRTSEAKRFYSMFGLLGNFALPVTGLAIIYTLSANVDLSSEELKINSEGQSFVPIICLTILSNLVVMFLYNWINKNVLTDPRLYDAAEKAGAPKKKKPKLSLGDSFKMIFTSKYLGLLVTLVLAYGISINLVEGVWKAKVKELYPTKEAYTMYMGTFQAYQGVAAILFMLVGSNILRRVSWATAAIFTPVMIFITGLAFFSFIVFDQSVGLYFAAFFGTGPLALAVIIGMGQNVLSKATKYSLFDSTKEMAYIPLDDEMKSKGKAAVDVIGGRFGKSGGGIIQSTFFMLMPAYTFFEATPYFGAIFFVIVILWIFAVYGLSKEYQIKIAQVEKKK